ncbi:hypothetical protein CYMTET_18903 [Cymbomonas tetramitiformis]|uniref:Uncharacterized protein n=1 Tax=Cymbomonas tetramitiformis TaxID=36881 RepID=A0AAE0G7N0_9CHLO|nr:hypothetical protein CYMTET_18903 [Cymbomonas tetramitiformis]
MAFVSRAQRRTEEGNGSKPPPAVGPGAYMGQPQYKTDHGYAPFASTCERATQESTTTATYNPGPGSYQRLARANAANNSSINSFASRVGRFHEDKSTAQEAPGPGQYGDNSTWIKNTHRYVLEQPQRRVTFQRMPTAPSVPARHQSFGYEEGDGGELIMQKAPESGHTGMRSDTVGPAKYSPDHNSVQTTRKADFSKSRSQRELYSLQNTPGPGTYTKKTERPGEPSIAENDPITYTGGPTSTFASRVPLKHEVQQDEEREVPGPGSYSDTSQFRQKRVPEAHQFFGSTSMRAYQVDAPRLRAVPTGAKTPGPGAYDEKRSSFAPQRMGPDAPPFQSTGMRFDLPKQQVANPGPGTYDEANEISFTTDLSKKVVSRNGVFGTTTQRFASTKSSASYLFMGNDEAPGPGQYEEPEGSPSPSRLKKTSSVFASTSNRFQKEKANTDPGKPKTQSEQKVPPPGSYESENYWVDKKSQGMRRSEAFISAAPRFNGKEVNPGMAANTIPGPGSYEPKKLEKPPHNRSCFISNSSRFDRSTSVAPGPGTYANEDPSNAMVKRSFNVTIDGVNF